MVQYLPNQIDAANLAYHYTAEQTAYGIYYRRNGNDDQFPAGFYESESQPASNVSNSLPTIALSICVFKGFPLDYQKYRHAGLCLRPDDGGTAMMIHTTGPNTAYELQTKDNFIPSKSLSFAKEVTVGTIRTPMTKARLAALIYETPIDNRNAEFNCLIWVGDALERLAAAGYITKEECTGGIDKMVEATMEAEEEPEPGDPA
ncbi:uncharacterized protein J4E78_006120 [Alternaria triticimaculans]|uniref:uncharacterized protein n=1 Tax=Alternaria triticimaculans TaxID=297637 RepID=UPI0020C258A7|nr:uncharacterized protein J4E78_006120 [Alternaria triticimaculans]KAI4657732.1 hypothetical protein J4E78_006120 [Alternaria triticimaculans]